MWRFARARRCILCSSGRVSASRTTARSALASVATASLALSKLCAQLYRDLEAFLKVGLLQPQKPARQDEMPGRGDRQKFRDSLDNSQNDALHQRHRSISAYRNRLGSVVATPDVPRNHLDDTLLGRARPNCLPILLTWVLAQGALGTIRQIVASLRRIVSICRRIIAVVAFCGGIVFIGRRRGRPIAIRWW
jgi:hypothetical protein